MSMSAPFLSVSTKGRGGIVLLVLAQREGEGAGSAVPAFVQLTLLQTPKRLFIEKSYSKCTVTKLEYPYPNYH